jgi:hypothetical protein
MRVREPRRRLHEDELSVADARQRGTVAKRCDPRRNEDLNVFGIHTPTGVESLPIGIKPVDLNEAGLDDVGWVSVCAQGVEEDSNVGVYLLRFESDLPLHLKWAIGTVRLERKERRPLGRTRGV